MTRLARRARYALAVALWRLADALDDVAIWIDPRQGVRR